MNESPDVLVLGSGIAGLFFALKAARFGSVAVVTKKDQPESNTNYAQGGIAAALASDDSPELHARDTYVAGAGLCHTDAVESLVREGPRRVRELMALGARFTTHNGDLSLGREGGHSRRRIVRAADLTGREVERALLTAVAAEPNIEIHENAMAVDLLVGYGPDAARRCVGATVLLDGETVPIAVGAKAVMIATGGCGQVYAHTTNPAIATGDGIAMAYRAGAKIANMEFVQFHPTALYPAGDRAFLISEAVRGEGGILRRRDGTEFMKRYHPLGSLAPRDVVALAIDRELKESGDPFVLLDCSPLRADEIRTHFPNILAVTARHGIDMTREPLPVVPAAHYMCGGILSDTSGRTSLPGLYAIGESACTGVHGANRLASNSLLEALVFAGRAAEQIGPRIVDWRHAAGEAVASNVGTGVDTSDPGTLREEIRQMMWDLVGIVRADSRLLEASIRLTDIQRRFAALAAGSRLSSDLLELRNLIQCGALIIASALARKESRGLNFNMDHPYRDNERFLADTVISLWNEGSYE